MFQEEDMKTNNLFLLEREGNGVVELKILQNWRNILKIERISTSGSRASDVWGEPEIFNISAKEFTEMLNEEIIDPWGMRVSLLIPESNLSL